MLCYCRSKFCILIEVDVEILSSTSVAVHALFASCGPCHAHPDS